MLFRTFLNLGNKNKYIRLKRTLPLVTVLRQKNPAYIQMSSFCWSLLPYQLCLYSHTRLFIETKKLCPLGPRWETIEGGSFTGDFEKKVRYFLSGDLFNWRLGKICNRKLWKRTPLFMGALLGNLKGGSFYRGLWRKGPILSTLRNMEWKVLKTKHFCVGLNKGSLRLAREGSASTFIGLGHCPLTGYNPG